MNKTGLKKIGVLIVLLFLGAGLLYALFQYQRNNVNPDLKPTATTPQTAVISVNGTELSLDASPSGERYFDIATLYTDLENSISVVSADKDALIKVNQQSITQGVPFALTLDKIAPQYFIEIDLNDTRFYIHTLPSTFPLYHTNISQSTPPEYGVYYLVMDPYIVKMDTQGRILYYKLAKSPDDFRRWEQNGKVRYTYFEKTVTKPLTGVLYTPDKLIIMDERYQVIDSVATMLGEPIEDEYSKTPLDAHDALYFDDGHYMIIAYQGKRVNNIPDSVKHSPFGARVTAAIIQEIKDGEILWQWDSTEHPELYTASVEGNDYFNRVLKWSDYAHLNSINIDPSDNHVVASFRNLDAVLKIDRSTGKILWTFGGVNDNFGLTEEQKFSRQHFAYYTDDGRMVLFNNGNKDPMVGYPISDIPDEEVEIEISTIVDVLLDESVYEVIDYQSWRFNDQFSGAMGSAQKTADGVYAICWAFSTQGSALFSEIDFINEEVLFEIIMEDTATCYRLHKYHA